LLDNLIQEKASQIALIRYHGTTPVDSFWVADSSEIRQRINYYGVKGVPTFFFNGALSSISIPFDQTVFSPSPSNFHCDPLYIDSYQSSPLQIQLDASYDSLTHQGIINAHLTFEENLKNLGLRIYFAITESNLFYQYYSRTSINNQVLRKMIPDALGMPLIWPGTEPSWIVSKEFTLDPSWKLENCEIVAFVQSDYSKNILQGAKIRFPLERPFLVIKDSYVSGGTGENFIEPGEEANLIVSVANLNPWRSFNVNAALFSTDEYVTLQNFSSFLGSIGGKSDFSANSSNPFKFYLSPQVPLGYKIYFNVKLSAWNGYEVIWPIKAKVGNPTEPAGPDKKGYYLYENWDSNYVKAPVFNWVEIDPKYGGGGSVICSNDELLSFVHPPFDFVYQGKSYDKITLSPNGWVALDSVRYYYYEGLGIPDTLGPPNAIFGFLADLDPGAMGGGRAYYYADTLNHRVIFEWSRVKHWTKENKGLPETFEIILYDPNFFPTPSGDGEVIIQYLNLSQPNSCTIGIQDSAKTDGIEYVHKGEKNATSHNLVNGTALKFTTFSPNEALSVEEEKEENPPFFSLEQNFPNPFNSTTTIKYNLAKDGFVQLEIFNILGQKVKTLVKEFQKKGTKIVKWEGKDEQGKTVPSGIYLYRLMSDQQKTSKQMLLLK
jgi:hypothetical protein